MADFSPVIGRVFGIDIQIHWTLLILLIFSLISPVFFIIILLLWVCVFLHELSHSFIALKNKIKVKKIVLNLLGGASMIDTDKLKQDIEFKISIIGPIVSIFLGLLFGIFVIYLNGGILKQIIQSLFLLNMLLGILNLLPAFPLDGGRVFRSYLEKTRDFVKSTQITAKSTNIIAFLIIAGSLIYVGIESSSLIYKEFFVFWDIIIALFLYSGAQAELQSVYIKKYSSKLHAKDAMTKNFILVKQPKTIDEIYNYILKFHTHLILFKDNNKIYLVSKFKNIYRQKNLISKNIANSNIIKSISIQIPAIQYNMPLSKALDLMGSNETSIIAVTKKNQVIGVLLESHVESIISLQMSKELNKINRKNEKTKKNNN